MSDYFSNWRTSGYTCAQCAWTGTGKEASHELFAELFKVNCPQCDARLDVIYFRGRPERSGIPAAKAPCPSLGLSDVGRSPRSGPSLEF